MKKIFFCDFCGEKNGKLLFVNFDHLTKKNKFFNLIKCGKCGLVYLSPKPKNIKKYYLDNYEPYNPHSKDLYFSFYQTLVKSFYKKKKTLIDLSKSVFCRIFYPQPTSECGKILDIGCGNGGYLSILKDGGWEVYGLDFSKKAVDFAQNERGLINIKQARTEILDYPNNFFDLITMNHLIEHLPNPKKTLIEAKRVLKTGGIISITTPNFSSLNEKIFKTNWFPLETPRHLFLFEAKVLIKLIGEIDGLRVTKVKHDYSSYCFAKSLGYLLGNRPSLNRFLMTFKIFFYHTLIF